jgi:hypothetical protein
MSSVMHGGGGRSFHVLGFLQGAVRVAIFVGLLGLVLLLLWPAALAGKRGKDDDVLALVAQRQTLARAVQFKRAVTVEVSESALNAYLAVTLKAAHAREEAVAAWMMRLDDLNVALQPGVVTVTTLAHWGPVAITWELTGVPKVADGRFALEVKSGRIGHLGLPQAGAEWMATRMAVVLNRWSADRELLDQLAGVSVAQSTATLVSRQAQP